MLVQDIMTKDVVTVKPSTSIKEIAKLIVEKDVSGVPVVDDEGRVAGIVSEGDLIKREMAPQAPEGLCILGAVIIYKGLEEYRDTFRKLWAATAKQIMTKKVVSVAADADVSEAARLMSENHVKRVPVVNDEERLLGIVSRRDIVRLLF